MVLEELSRVANEAVGDIIQESRQDSQIMNELKRSNLKGKKKRNDHVSNNEMKYLLDKCLDQLGNFNEQARRIKRNKDIEVLKLEGVYVYAYFYYKIIHILVTSIIPNLPEFYKVRNGSQRKISNIESELLQIYNIILQTLISDDVVNTIHEVKSMIKRSGTGASDIHFSTQVSLQTRGTSQDIDTNVMTPESMVNDSRSGYISNVILDNANLMNHLSIFRDETLLVDLRQRNDFDKGHIDFPNIVCLEPISFKEHYTFKDLTKKSMITAPKGEIILFSNLDHFRYVVLSTGRSNDLKSNDSDPKIDILKNILLQYHDNSLKKDNKIQELLIHSDDFKSWKLGGYPVHQLDMIDEDTALTDGSSEEGELCEDYTEDMQSKIKDKEVDDSVYVSGNTRSLSLQALPELTPSISSSMDSTMRVMMNDNPLSYELPSLSQQKHSEKVKRSSSFKNFFSLSKSTMRGDHNRSNSTPMSEGKLTSLPSLSKMNRYPDTLSLKIPSPSRSISYPNSPIVKNSKTPVVSPITISQVSPVNARIHTYENNNMIPKHVPNGNLSKETFSPSGLNQLMQNGSKMKQVENKADLNFIVGLENMGNSCYMNCILQCVMGTNELTQIFLNNSYEKHINIKSKLGSKGVLARYFSRLVHTMYENGTEVKRKKVATVRPTQFRMAIASVNSLFRNSSQQDCQEFCQFLLDGLHEDLNQCGNNPPLKELSEEAEKKRESLSLRIASSIEWERFLTTNFSVIVDLFQGQYASRLKCEVCRTTSTTYQPFSVLSIPVPRSGVVSLLDCFNEFTKCEILETDEQWNCSSCKKKTPSTKQLTITRLPRNLILHLKRFDNKMNKNNIFVKYPFTLDLTSYWASDFDGKLPPGVSDNELPTRGQVPPFRYRLYAVANHYGSLFGGHYTSYVHKGITKSWYYFDDQNMKAVKNSNDVVNSNAYVLFYHRIHGI